ncbi:MAG: ATP-binding protein, partial [Clostridia bacterium]
HHAFYNLVENAMKYNVEGGSVQIDLSTAGARSVVTVSDTGIGIPDDMRALVFEPFFRVDPSRTRKMGGTGLGLSIVASILEKHHGQIAILDRLGGGVAFQITL